MHRSASDPPPALEPLPPADLAAATGGVSRTSSSSSAQLQLQLSAITDSLRDLKNQRQSSSSELLPMMLMMRIMRDRMG